MKGRSRGSVPLSLRVAAVFGRGDAGLSMLGAVAILLAIPVTKLVAKLAAKLAAIIVAIIEPPF